MSYTPKAYSPVFRHEIKVMVSGTCLPSAKRVSEFSTQYSTSKLQQVLLHNGERVTKGHLIYIDIISTHRHIVQIGTNCTDAFHFGVCLSETNL